MKQITPPPIVLVVLASLIFGFGCSFVADHAVPVAVLWEQQHQTPAPTPPKSPDRVIVPGPAPIPNPQPIPKPEPQPAPVAVQLVIADMEQIPARMNLAGFTCRPTLCWYGLAQSFSGLDWDLSVAIKNNDTETLDLAKRQPEILAWWSKYLDTIASQLKSNPLAHAVVILHDNPDSCGFRLGPATMDYLKDYSGQLTMGTVITSW